MTTLDETRLALARERLQMIRDLPDGWWGPGSKKAIASQVELTESLLETVASVETMSFCIDGDGHFVFEAYCEPWAVHIVFDDHQMYVLGDHVHTDELQEEYLPLTVASFTKAVAKYSPEAGK